MRIVYVIARFYPFSGGAEEYIFQLAKRAATAGHEVTVLTTDASTNGEKLNKEEVIDGIKIIRIHRWNQQLNLGFYPTLLAELIRIPADVVHVGNGPGFVWQEFCLFWKHLFSPGTKFVASPHGPFLATPGTHKGIKKFVAVLAKYTLGTWYKLTWHFLFNHVLADNPVQTKWLNTDYHFPVDKIHLVPIGISKDYVEAQRQNSEKDLSKPTLITSVARLAKYKGFLDIVEAVQILEQRIKSEDKESNYKVVFMGRPEKPFVSELQSKIENYNLQDKVEILESPTNEQRDQLLRESQINILASEWEATGIALLEAMASRNAIITTTGNEAAHLLIEEGVNGYIYNPHDVSALASFVQELLNNPELRIRMGEVSSQRVNDFVWEEIFPKYLNILNT